MSIQRKLTLIVFLLLFSACSSGLTGKIYLDVNGNDIREDSEKLLAGLTFKVTLDDEEIATGTTDANGEFNVDINKAGQYCVIVGESDIINSNVTQVTPSTLVTATSDSDLDQLIDEMSSESLSFLVKTAETTTTDSGDSTSGSTDTPATIESGKACDDSSGFVLEMDVPIGIAYDADVSTLSDQSYTISRSSGSNSFSLVLAYPLSCTLRETKLPDYIIPVSSDVLATFNTTTRKINFSEAVETDSVSCITESASLISQDSLRTCTINFELDEDKILGSSGSDNNTFTPYVICPDDSEVELQTFTVNFNGNDDIEITSTSNDDVNNNNDTWESGDIVTITTTITNNSSIDFSDDTTQVTVTTPTSVSGATYAISPATNTCNDNVCDINLDADGGEVVLTTTYVIPSGLSDTTDFDTDISLDVVFDGETITFTDQETVTVIP